MATRRLIDLMNEEEKIEEVQEQKATPTKKKSTVTQIMPRDGAKDKQISAKVNLQMYEAFTQINKIQGLSNNSALNMLIARYVRENKTILSDDMFF